MSPVTNRFVKFSQFDFVSLISDAIVVLFKKNLFVLFHFQSKFSEAMTKLNPFRSANKVSKKFQKKKINRYLDKLMY